MVEKSNNTIGVAFKDLFVIIFMDKETLRNKGGLNAILCIILGLLFSILPFSLSTRTSLSLFLFFSPETEINTYFVIGLLTLIIIGYFLGRKASIEIILKKRNKYLITYLYGLSNILTTAFIYGSIRLIGQPCPIELDNNLLIVFFYRPVFLSLLFGLPSLLLFGLLFAKRISKLKYEQ